MGQRARTKAGAALRWLLSLFLLLVARPGWAHQVGLSRGEYAVAGATVTAQLTFARRELATVVEGLDADGDGVIDPGEVERGRAALERSIVARIDVRGDGAACPGTLVTARLAEEDGLGLWVSFRCPAAPGKVVVDLPLLDDFPFGHRHLARAVSGGETIAPVLFRAQRSFEMLGAPGSAPDAAAPKRAGGALALFSMGVQHILTGYDHLVFLFGLVLVGGRLRSIVTVVTAFTLAHSITLAIAVLGVWAPSPRLVEPAIALSIAYVGVENFFVADARRRWRITFPFGLVHGFGFAGALQEIAMPRGDIPGALVLFNVGVEAGQLAVLAVVLPLVFFARRQAWFRDVGVRVLSAAVIVAGVVWFVARVV